MAMWGVLFGFFVGALAVLAAEAVAVLAVIDWLRRKTQPEAAGAATPGRDLDGEQSLVYATRKKGIVWLLEPEKVPRTTTDQLTSKVLKEQKVRKGIVEVSPTKKFAKIKDHSLILEDIDGSQEKATIQLMDCTILAVSASDLPSRKWAKRYPIRVESKTSEIYKGSKNFYLFLETSWEKEAWCKALRLASCSDKGKLKWFNELREDFHHYLSSLHTEYPSFMKPSELFVEPTDKTSRIDASSRVRYFLKKLAKKATKSGAEHKASTVSLSNRGENRVGERLYAIEDVSSSTGLVKTSSTEKSSSASLQDLIQSTVPTFTNSGSPNQVSFPSDLTSNERLGVDEGSICFNLLLSRLFFDAKRSTDLNRFIKERIQRSLSNMRTPSYIGGITCTGLHLGNVPPYIRSVRVLPMDLNDVWAFEVDIEYSGGILLDIETRLEVCEPDFQRGLVDPNLEPNTAEITSDLLEGFEHYGDQLKCSSETTDKMENKIVEDKVDGLKQSKSTSWASTYVSRWKSIVNSLAEQVSQVPLSLSIKIASLRGTLRLHMKPPPSDQLWLGFTSMPEIEWNLDSSVGDHKITRGHIALVIGNRFKTAIQEMLVLPNCESIYIPWMLAEKDDWIPRSVAPFIWIHQEAGDLPADLASISGSGEPKVKQDGGKGTKASTGSIVQDNIETRRGVIYSQPTHPEPTREVAPSNSVAPVTSASTHQITGHNVLEDLKQPLLRNDDVLDSCSQSGAASPENLSGTIVLGEQKTETFEEDAKPKRMGRRARMMDLGKKMGEKLEEKRRHIEEKGRHIVEKMRENTRQ